MATVTKAKPETANTLTTFDGKVVTARTRDGLLYAQALWQKKRGHKKKIRLAQGSFNHSVPASGTTHDGDAVCDVRTRGVGLDNEETRWLLWAIKRAGGIAWIRDERDGMDPHLHVLWPDDKQMSSSAKAQVVDYDNGRNGLRSNKKDRNPWRVEPPIRYSYAAGKPMPRAA